MATENTFPTIADLHKAMTNLIERGFGDLPIQIVIAPDSTLQILADRQEGQKPALMIEWHVQEGRQPVAFVSTARLDGGRGAMPTVAQQ